MSENEDIEYYKHPTIEEDEKNNGKKFSEMTDKGKRFLVRSENSNLFHFVEYGPYFNKDPRVATSRGILTDHIISEREKLEKLQDRVNGFDDELEKKDDEIEEIKDSKQFYEKKSSFLLSAARQYAKPCHVDKLHDRTYRCMVSNSFVYGPVDEWGWGDKLTIVTIPQTVDINAPLKIKDDPEGDGYFEIFKGGFKLLTGVAQAIRDLEKTLADPKDEKRENVQEWEVQAWDNIQKGKPVKLSYNQLSKLTGRPTNTIKSYVSRFRKRGL